MFEHFLETWNESQHLLQIKRVCCSERVRFLRHDPPYWTRVLGDAEREVWVDRLRHPNRLPRSPADQCSGQNSASSVSLQSLRLSVLGWPLCYCGAISQQLSGLAGDDVANLSRKV
jgi:hypothetical protein